MATAKIDFRNVGQGLCQTGNIRNFYFMYDCGSKAKSAIITIIDRMEKIEKQPGLDLLVISHFDEDHINGLDKLMRTKLKPKKVVLPYLSPIDRLISALKSTDAEEWYLEFLIDPVGYLLNNDITEIYVITGENPEAPEPSNPENPLPKGDDGSDFHFMPPKTKGRFDSLDDQDTYAKHREAPNNYYFIHHNTLFSVSGKWQFKFFNLGISEIKRQRFVQALANANLHNSTQILKVLGDKNKIKKLKKAYKKIATNLNSTSLCLFHGPLTDRKGLVQVRTNRYLYQGEKEALGVLLTGDFCMWTNSHFIRFTKHYEKELNRTAIYLLPHHGSKTGWNPDMILQLPRDCFWLYCASINRYYDHPEKIVLDGMLSENILFSEVNEKYGLEILITLPPPSPNAATFTRDIKFVPPGMP